MPEVIFETNSDISIAYWGAYGASGGHHHHVNYDSDSKYIYTTQEAAEWRDIRFGITLAGFDYTNKSINLVKVQFRCTGILLFHGDSSEAKALIRCGSGGSDPWFTDYGSEKYLSEDYVDYEQAWTLNPCTTQAWAWADIVKLQIGISGIPYYHHNVGEWISAYCSRLKLLVDYNDWLTPPEEASGFFQM